VSYKYTYLPKINRIFKYTNSNVDTYQSGEYTTKMQRTKKCF